MVAKAAAFNLGVLAVMAEQGMLTACAQDADCGAAMATAALRLSLLYHPVVGPLVWAIFRAFPIALFSYVWATTTPVILAVLKCYAAGHCTAQEEAENCIEWKGSPRITVRTSISVRWKNPASHSASDKRIKS